MDFFKWNDKYSVGISEIDLQHQELLRILNKMLGLFGKATPAEISITLDDITDYTAFHFQTEDKYLNKHPEYDQHRQEHNDFIKKNNQLKTALQESNTDMSEKVLHLLLVWLKNHILKTDIRFFDDIKKMNQ